MYSVSRRYLVHHYVLWDFWMTKGLLTGWKWALKSPDASDNRLGRLSTDFTQLIIVTINTRVMRPQPIYTLKTFNRFAFLFLLLLLRLHHRAFFRVDCFGMDASNTSDAYIRISNDVISKSRNDLVFSGELDESVLTELYAVSWQTLIAWYPFRSTDRSWFVFTELRR